MDGQNVKKNNASKKLMAGMVIFIILTLCLCITTVALVIASLRVENNLFRTGLVDINLNDGKTIVEETGCTFEPGATVEREFFIENNSTFDVYYKIYFANVSGQLADVLKVSIKDGETVIYSGTANELSREAVIAAPDALKIEERKNLTVSFYFPPEAGNAAQNAAVAFDIGADAVQTKNNPNRLFD